MSRSGYTDDIENNWDLIMYRGAVASAIRGKRGQAFLKEMLDALDKLESRRLIAHDLEADGEVCAIGAVGKCRGVEMKSLDPEDSGAVADAFGVADALAKEIVWMNDEGGFYKETPYARYARMRAWIQQQIKTAPADQS
jgi:hypothetical protein